MHQPAPGTGAQQNHITLTPPAHACSPESAKVACAAGLTPTRAAGSEEVPAPCGSAPARHVREQADPVGAGTRAPSAPAPHGRPPRAAGCAPAQTPRAPGRPRPWARRARARATAGCATHSAAPAAAVAAAAAATPRSSALQAQGRACCCGWLQGQAAPRHPVQPPLGSQRARLRLTQRRAELLAQPPDGAARPDARGQARPQRPAPQNARFPMSAGGARRSSAVTPCPFH